MTSLLFGISIAALLSTTSLMIVVFRISPLTSPAQAIPAFFVSILLTISTVGTLAFMLLWKLNPHVNWDLGKLTGISLRQGIFLGLAVTILLGFHLLSLLTWWIGLCIFAVFLFIELALEH